MYPMVVVCLGEKFVEVHNDIFFITDIVEATVSERNCYMAIRLEKGPGTFCCGEGEVKVSQKAHDEFYQQISMFQTIGIMRTFQNVKHFHIGMQGWSRLRTCNAWLNAASASRISSRGG